MLVLPRRVDIEQSRTRWWFALLLWCLAAAAFVAAGSPTTLAAVVVVPFALAAPGVAVALLLRLGDLALAVTVVILTGVAVGVIVPSILLYAGAWSPRAAFAIVAAGTFVASTAGLFTQGSENHGRGRSPSDHPS